MKVQILGSNGYIGKNFTHFLNSLGNIDLELFDVQTDSIHSNLQYSFLDISDKSQVSKINFDSDFIFIFSGLTGTGAGFTKYEDYIRVNELGLLNIIDTLKEQNYKGRIIFPSTRLVYKGIKDTPLKEDSEKEFKTPYAINKYSCEQFLKMYNNMFGLNYTIFRICVPYGNNVGNEYSFGTVGFFLNKASKGENISLYGDGSQKRTFSHIKDICTTMWSATNSIKTLNDVYNIGGETFNLKNAAEIIADKFGVVVEFTDWPEVDLKLESGDTIFDSTKLDSIIEKKYDYKYDEWVKKLKS
ncbi:MAG: NAD-dependent epimerase/dehydratase family protein [Bacteroidetes bacterium]|nr:NAD-dependent epimerase/dehydratase family protein [Bacteroidota bacterium]